MVKGLTEKRQINGIVFDGGRLDISESVFQVFEAVLGCRFCSEGYHFFRVVDGNNSLRFLRKELREGSFARPQIRHNLEI